MPTRAPPPPPYTHKHLPPFLKIQKIQTDGCLPFLFDFGRIRGVWSWETTEAYLSGPSPTSTSTKRRSHDPHQATKRKKEEEEEGGKGKGKVCVLWGGNSPKFIRTVAVTRKKWKTTYIWYIFSPIYASYEFQIVFPSFGKCKTASDENWWLGVACAL